MKDMKMKKIIRFGLLMEILLLLLAIMACSSSTETTQSVETAETQVDETVSTESKNTQNSDTILQENFQAEKVSEKDTETDDKYDRKRAMIAYQQALTQLYEKQVFPDGIEAECDSINYDISKNQFAVYDVDMDGRDELIILFTTSISTAGMRGCIYDYDEATDSLYLELISYPSMRFYDNAVLEVDASHSQGYAGDFWPYSLYVFDSDDNTYQESVCVDAWDKKLAEIDYKGNAFPEEADSDGDGIVYYLLHPGKHEYHDPIDWDDYETWHNATVGNAIEVPYEYLTPEHITALK